MKHSDPGSLPPCVLSTRCLRLLNDLDAPDALYSFEQVFSTSASDRRDDLLIEQVRSHLPGCPTCAAALAQARQLRSQQRIALRRYLAESESRVPSTTKRIFAALQDEEPSSSPRERRERKRPDHTLPEVFLPLSSSTLLTPPATPELNGNHSGDYRHITDPLTLSPSRRWLRNGLALATVAVLLFATLGIFGHFIFRPATGGQVKVSHRIPETGASPSPTATESPPGNVSPTAEGPFDGWNGVVLITGTGSTYNLITTYNYLDGNHRLLVDAGANIQFDWVASQGQNMLYQVTDNGHTLYFTLNKLPTTGFFYELDEENALNAIWMPDNIHVLIATVHDGVVAVNTQTGQSQPYLPKLKTQALKFYRDGYLYFLGGPDRAGDTLFRINVTSGIVEQVTFRSMGGDFWLSPDGATVYFKTAGPVGPSGIYAVNSDGTSGTVLRPDGTPIGYAADDSLVIMREVNHQFEVVQLGATPQQDRVVMRDVAPGAISLCDPSFSADTMCDTTNIALSPLGHALIVIASYSDGSRKVWSDDLATGQQFMMLAPSDNEGVIVPGWDRIIVS